MRWLQRQRKDEHRSSLYYIEAEFEVEYEIGAPWRYKYNYQRYFYLTYQKKVLKTLHRRCAYPANWWKSTLWQIQKLLSLSQTVESNCRQTEAATLKDIVYQLYGRDWTLCNVDYRKKQYKDKRCGCRPEVTRSSRNLEKYLCKRKVYKGQYIKAVGTASRDELMQHQYPFCLTPELWFGRSGCKSSHPRKMEMNFQTEFCIWQYKRAVEEIFTTQEVR